MLDHCGGPVGRGRFANRREETFREWRTSIQEIAKCPNVVVKLGGLAMCLLIALSLADCGGQVSAESREYWDVYYLGGVKAGYANTTISPEPIVSAVISPPSQDHGDDH